MLNDTEISTVLKELKELYHYDFTSYSRDSFKRRINRFFTLEKFSTFEEFRAKLNADTFYINHLVDRITVNITDMFRDHGFFEMLRKEIIPTLAGRPRIRVWHAGCSTGEEVYSVAILLQEAGLLHKSEIRATDINPHVIEQARSGVFTANQVNQYAKNYLLSGGEKDFSSYFDMTPAGVKINPQLSSRISFTTHSLANDGYIGRFDLIVCRNVLIYFDKQLQDQTLGLFTLSLSPNSYLALGERETILFSGFDAKFKQVGPEKIWKKI